MSPLLLVFLTAFAIVDDIMAVGVIAIFYTDHIDWGAVGIAAVLLALLILANRAGISALADLRRARHRRLDRHLRLGDPGTLAGVLVAMTVPRAHGSIPLSSCAGGATCWTISNGSTANRAICSATRPSNMPRSGYSALPRTWKHP